MPSTYTDSLRIEKQANGENENTWGTITNANFELFEDGITGVQSITVSNANYTLSTTNGSADEARHAVLNVEGSVATSSSVIFPDVEKTYIVRANQSGGHIRFKNTSGTGVTVNSGVTTVIFTNGSETYKINGVEVNSVFTSAVQNNAITTNKLSTAVITAATSVAVSNASPILHGSLSKSTVADVLSRHSIKSDTTGVTGADQVANVIALTSAEYAAVSPKISSVLYIITDAD